MELKLLDEHTVQSIYNEHMVIDFPKDELKPLPMILKAMKESWYEPLGVYDATKLIGYVFVIRMQNSYLIDYLATFPEVRNKGKGANLLSLLKTHLSDADSIIGEVEDPAYTPDEEQAALQQRRIGFYKRNGCYDTGLRVECFGMKYIILESGSTNLSADEAWKLYGDFYRSFLPKEKFDNCIHRII